MILKENPRLEKLLIWGVFFTSLIYFIYHISGIMIPFVAGILVAYLLNPLASLLVRFKLPRVLSTMLLILTFFLSIAGLMTIAFPFLKRELLKLAVQIPDYGDRLYQTLTPYIQTLSQYVDQKSIEMIKNTASGHVGDMISWGLKLVAGLFTNSLALANLISLIILTPVVAFYLLRDWPNLVESLESLFPKESKQSIKKLLSEINRTLKGYIQGQLLVCLTLGLFYTLAYTFIGLDFSITLGCMTGILAFIPYIGFFIGATAAISIALAQFPDWTSPSYVMIILGVGQLLESNFLTPKLVGDRVGLHPVWIIFALLTGGFFFGFLGLVIALPVAATLGVLVRFLISKYKGSVYYLGTKRKKIKSPA
ncbi:MAG: AI-2E family transporter [Alphaproteobacteria bacterium]|nr:AI-2E family transporter [Alphaproteobacteria bacterium]